MESYVKRIMRKIGEANKAIINGAIMAAFPPAMGKGGDELAARRDFKLIDDNDINEMLDGWGWEE